jgi:asparagine synthase (glutamine-hydrolysing)
MLVKPEAELAMPLIGGTVSWESDGLAPSARMHLGDLAGASRTIHGPALCFENSGLTCSGRVGDLCVVADLDLTNEKELRNWTDCRTGMAQLVAALYAKTGWRFVSRLRGAFAIALWDERNRDLLLAVDHFGVKRLHYLSDRQKIFFASRASMLSAMAGGGRPESTAVYNYLNFGFVPAPTSIFGGVVRLAPGHLLKAHAGRATSEPYWDMKYPESRVALRDGADALYRLTESAVARALDDGASNEAGAFLSGGTDSSTVVGMMTRATDRTVNAFSVGFQENAYDELDYARLAARHFGATHHTRIVAPEDAFALLPRLVDAFDEPFGNNSAIGTYFCVALARERGVKLLLAGDGGDEIFGGNERYRTDRIFARYSDLPRGLRRGVIEPVLMNLPDGGAGLLGKAQRYIRRASLPNPRRFFSYEFFFALEAGRLFTPEFLAAVDLDAPYRVAQACYDRAQATSELNRLLYTDLKLAIGDNDLLKVTRTAELAGVTVRFPMLDLDLVEFTGTLPARLKVRGLEKRYLFKRALRGFLPREILAKHKHGFGVPTSAWLRDHPQFQELARETVLSTRARARGYFRAGVIEDLVDAHRNDTTTPYYGDLLWRILMLELWERRHLDGATA